MAAQRSWLTKRIQITRGRALPLWFLGCGMVIIALEALNLIVSAGPAKGAISVAAAVGLLIFCVISFYMPE